MWEYILYSFLFVCGTFLADYLCSFILEKGRGLKQVIFEILIFLLVSNYLLFKTSLSGGFFQAAFVYFFYSFISMVFSRVLGFLIISKALAKVGFGRNDLNKSALKLAKKLSNKLGKDELIDYFKSSGYSSDFINHLEKTLK
jgi:sugar phosphate permease